MRFPLRKFGLNTVLAFLTAASLSAKANISVPDDQPYSQWRKGRTLYIYGPESQDFLGDLAAYNEAFRAMYDRSFQWKLDEEQDLVLLSPNQQISNAYATVVPNILSVWYPSGAGMLEDMAESSWILTLAAHETSHLYQMNSKGPFNTSLKKIFGNAFTVTPFVWPIFIHPNLFAPTSLLEGNAVLNESRVNMGGRLHSGEVRALVLAQISAGDVDATRLINDEFIYPFGENAYVQGGYFQAHLAAKYGIERTNSFFKAQGDHYLWPLILNDTFREHFGSSYYQEVREYLREMQSLAIKQQLTPGKALAEATFISPLNQDDKSIWWLASDGHEPPTLYEYRKQDGHLTRKQMDLPMGKVFFENGQPLVSASVNHDLHHIEYSLYGEHAHFDPRFRGQIVTDWRDGKIVSLDARHSWLDPQVLVNGEFYDVAHSNPVLDKQGNVFYFRQNGFERMLYRNREPLTVYHGFYGKLTEATADDGIYFIGNTDYGSTLYQFKDQEVRRILDSDRVIDARQIDATHFLVLEVESRGHRVLIAEAHPRSAQPATYSYGFPTENVVPAQASDKAQVKGEARPYNGLKELRYGGTDFAALYAGGPGFGASLLANFADPMMYHNLSLGYQGTQFSGQVAQVNYSYTRYLPALQFSYVYHDNWWQSANGKESLAANQDFLAGFKIPLLRRERWDASLSLALTYKSEEPEYDGGLSGAASAATENTLGTLTDLQWKWAVPTALGLLPWRQFSLEYLNHVDATERAFKKRHNTSMVRTQATYGLPMKTYVSGFAAYAWAEDPDVDVQFNPYPFPGHLAIPRLVSHDEYSVTHAASFRLELQRDFVVPQYFPRFPIGLNRVAPLVVGQELVLDEDPLHIYPPDLFEWGWGADFDVLLIHKLVTRVRYLQSYDTRHPQTTDNQVELNLVGHF